MDDQVDVVFRSGTITRQFKLEEVPTFDSFVSKLKGQLGDDIPHLFNFEINVDQKCSLHCEADYKNMVLLCTLLNRTVVYIGAQVNIVEPTVEQSSQTNPIGEERQQAFPTIPNYFPQRKQIDRTVPDLNGNFRRGAGAPKRKGTSVPTFLFDDDQYGSPESFFDSLVGVKRLTKRQMLKNRNETGEWYAGAQTHIPVSDMAHEEEPIVLRSANWVNYITHIGQEFYGGMAEFRSKLIKYSAKLGFRYVYTKNDATYVRAECKQKEEEGCGWYLKGTVSKVTGALVIKHGVLEHKCTMSMMTCDSKRMGQRLIGDFITDAIRATPILTATDLKRDIYKYWGFDIDYDKVWRAVEVARANIFGCYDDSFDELRWYADGILRTNPGSVVSLETEPTENRFQRFFVAFDASLKGFKHCRPMLFVDGTFMKTRYKGTLLSATAKDGNNGLFPVAIAIVDSENADNWTWFIKMIRKHVHHNEEIMFTSDRAGGLLNAFNSLPNKPRHFYCLFHLMKNLRGMYPGKKYSDVFKNYMCKLLKDAAYAPNRIAFDNAIAKFTEKGGPQAVHFLEDLPPDKWAVAFTPEVHRYGELTSNAAESFNNWILDARSLPVTFMLDCIRMQLMRWFNERRTAVLNTRNALTPRINEMWNHRAELGQNWVIVPSNRNGIFEVLSSSTTVVDLHNRRCGCYQWQVEGFPCVHAVQVINKTRWPLRAVVESCFFTDSYMNVYKADIIPIPQTEKYEFIDLNQPSKILPPVHRVVPGRPRVKRIRSKGETSQQKRFLCGRCGKYGNHYWTTCAHALE